MADRAGGKPGPVPAPIGGEGAQHLILISALKAAGGLGLLLFGGEVLLRGAVGLAAQFGLSKLLIGFTVVAAATSMPELVVVLAAGLEGFPDVGVGNVVGSNIANILLILGAGALLWPIATRPSEVMRDGIAVLAASLLFVAFALIGTFSWIHGTIMLALLVGYLTYSYRRERRMKRARANEETEEAEDSEEAGLPSRWPVAVGLVLLGVVLLVVGSELLIDGAVDIARAIGVSDAVIGLTLVAVGTSLPELATAIVAGLRHHSEVALGNVLGSNLFNILAVLGVMSIAVPFSVSSEILGLDLWVMLGVSLLLLPVMLTGWRIGRGEGAFFLVLYAAYIGIQFQRMPMS